MNVRGTDLKAGLALLNLTEPIQAQIIKLLRNQNVIWERMNYIENRLLEQER
jgi:hypothetical protein